MTGKKTKLLRVEYFIEKRDLILGWETWDGPFDEQGARIALDDWRVSELEIPHRDRVRYRLVRTKTYEVRP